MPWGSTTPGVQERAILRHSALRLFIHTSSHVRLSLADISTRRCSSAGRGAGIDLFLVGGGSVEGLSTTTGA